jgi:hypothetical protein
MSVICTRDRGGRLHYQPSDATIQQKGEQVVMDFSVVPPEHFLTYLISNISDFFLWSEGAAQTHLQVE